MGLRVKLISQPENTTSRVLMIKHRRATAITPEYALPANFIDNDILSESVIGNIIELPKNYKIETLEKMSSSSTIEARHTYRANSLLNRASQDKLIVAIPMIDFKQREITPSKVREHVETLVYATLHPRIDLVCTPIVYGGNDKLVLQFTHNFLEKVTTYNTPVSLTVSRTYSKDLRMKIIESFLGNYIDENNNALTNFICSDYAASNPVVHYQFHNQIIALSKELEAQLGEPAAIYNTNVKYSRVQKLYKERPARDIASYFILSDIIGPNHRPIKLNETIITEEKETSHQILYRKTYTYRDTQQINQKELETLSQETKLTPTQLNKLLNQPEPKKTITIKKINTRNAIAESHYLQTLFKKNDKDTIIEYLNRKTISKIDKRLPKAIKTTRKLLYQTRIQPITKYT